jgi:hypothetical protein
MSRRRRWSDLSDRSRKLILIGATIEGVLKLAALLDLWRRPRGEIRGSKLRWAAAIVVLNSAGIVPVTYFVRGRRTAIDDT